MEKIQPVDPTKAEIIFVLAAIASLPTEDKNGNKMLGIHSVWSGFNEAFRKKFQGRDPIAVTGGMEKLGLIESRPWSKGVLLFKKGDMKNHRVDDALAKIEAHIKSSTVLRKASANAEKPTPKAKEVEVVKESSIEDIINV